MAAAAEADGAASSSTALTVEEVRTAFSSAGYRVGPVLNWDWTSPASSSFQVQDRSRDRILMVQVYPSTIAAEVARNQAAAQEPVVNAGYSRPSAAGPHLLSGYGQSVWLANIALVQTTSTQLERWYQVQIDRDNCVYSDSPLVADPSRPDLDVDPEFQQMVQKSVSAL